MHAFPAGSANNAVGGSGPLNKNIDMDTFHGRGAEGFTDYAASGGDQVEPFGRKRNSADRDPFNPKGNDVIHGAESYGLGTSTFLEGAPASKTDIERRTYEADVVPTLHHGPARSRSIAQRIRGLSQPRRQFADNGRFTSPVDRYGVRSPKSPVAYSAGGTATASSRSQGKHDEQNPFFEEYRPSFEKKDVAVRARESAEYTAGEDVITVSRERAMSSPRRQLERRVTADESGAHGTDAKPSGFISRVKSLKGGKGKRPEGRHV